jgi:hypothetical protein
LIWVTQRPASAGSSDIAAIASREAERGGVRSTNLSQREGSDVDWKELSEDARAGDFIYVPPYVPHQEINGSPNETCEAVVVRSGQAPVVINLDVETPELASAGHPEMPFHPGG